MHKVLVVDDDAQIRAAVQRALERFQYEVKLVEDAETAAVALEAFVPDLILLDIMLPGTSGIDFCREIRQSHDVPVIFLSGLDTEVDRIVGLEIGADDYLTKPFHPGELLARVKAVLRRTAAAPPAATPATTTTTIAHGSVEMDLNSHVVRVGEDIVDLTKTEFLLLKTLLQHPNRVYTREQLMSSAHGPGTYVSDRTINSHIRRLRGKLEDVGVDPIETVRGVGYKIAEE